jgi:hypothetical protein
VTTITTIIEFFISEPRQQCFGFFIKRKTTPKKIGMLDPKGSNSLIFSLAKIIKRKSQN